MRGIISLFVFGILTILFLGVVSAFSQQFSGNDPQEDVSNGFKTKYPAYVDSMDIISASGSGVENRTYGNYLYTIWDVTIKVKQSSITLPA